MDKMEKRPFIPTEIHVATLSEKGGILGLLSIQTTEGRLDIGLDRQTADAVVDAINSIRPILKAEES